MFIPLEKDGRIKIENYPFLGTWYRFTDRLKGKGLGSIKLHYESGIAQFDELHLLNVDTAFVNFEPTTKGLIIRFNKTNRIRAYGIAFTDIEAIKIKVEPVERKHILAKKNINRTKGKLILKDKINTIHLKIPVNRVSKIIDYLKNLELKEKLNIVH